MKKITIGFSKPKNKLFPIGSWIIRLYQKSEYSHVYMSFYSESLNRTLIYEAVGKGVRFIGLKEWEKHAVEVESFTLDIKECNSTRLLQYCVDNAQTKYGFFQNIGVVISNLFGLDKNFIDDGKNCSEIIAEILKLEGYVIDIHSSLVTPKDIHDALAFNNFK